MEIDLFDGHCDAALLLHVFGGSLRKNDRHMDLERGRSFRRYAQFFALFAAVEDFPNRPLYRVMEEQRLLLMHELGENNDLITLCRSGGEAETAFASGKAAAFLSVEGGELLDCSLERLAEAHRQGVRAVGLTWNHANALSGSIAEDRERGLSPHGRDFVAQMNRLGMLVDVSHLSDRGFWDVANCVAGPFFASHSNSRDIFFVPRNLTDQQFTAIIEHDGVAGLNLYAHFLGDNADIDTVVAHLEHFLNLGGEKNVSLGGDLDGCSVLPRGIEGIQHMERLFDRLLQRNYSQTLIRALFFDNLMRVVNKVCIM